MTPLRARRRSSSKQPLWRHCAASRVDGASASVSTPAAARSSLAHGSSTLGCRAAAEEDAAARGGGDDDGAERSGSGGCATVHAGTRSFSGTPASASASDAAVRAARCR